MNKEDIAIVITSIYGITDSVQKLLEGEFHVFLVCDTKTPAIDHRHPNLHVLTVEMQKEIELPYTQHLPEKHYSRKNVGYLYVIQQGYPYIYDTDDDTHFLDEHILDLPWESPHSIEARAAEGAEFFNPHAEITETLSWPRGYPLHEVDRPPQPYTENPLRIGVWQGLVEHDPDVDAIQRLLGLYPKFSQLRPVGLSRRVFCPFNSQNTLWHRDAFAALYLPTTCPMRATDIWRGYMAQAWLWGQNLHLGFWGPNTAQERNPHDLYDDFRQESPCYLHAHTLAESLLGVSTLTTAMERLVALRLVDPTEVSRFLSWHESLNVIS